MPIHKNPDGTWQWGKSGKKYKKKEDAVKQMKAIFSNGYVEKKASSDFVYTYLPKQNTAETQGILGTELSPNGWQKYKKRSGLNTKQEVIEYLNSLQPNRSKAFSAFSQPISQEALQDYKQFARQKQLYKVKLAQLIRDARVLSIYKTGQDKQTTKVQQISGQSLNWKTPRGQYLFSKIPHYIIAVKDGVVPPKYINRQAADTTLDVVSGDKLSQQQADKVLNLIIALHQDQNKYQKQTPINTDYKNNKLKYIKAPDTTIIVDNINNPKAVGMISSDKYKRNDYKWLTDLYVDPSLRGLRIGSSIIDAAQKAVLQSGFSKLRLGYYTQNPASALYTKLGYKQIQQPKSNITNPDKIKYKIAQKQLKKKAAKHDAVDKWLNILDKDTMKKAAYDNSQFGGAGAPFYQSLRQQNAVNKGNYNQTTSKVDHDAAVNNAVTNGNITPTEGQQIKRKNDDRRHQINQMHQGLLQGTADGALLAAKSGTDALHGAVLTGQSILSHMSNAVNYPFYRITGDEYFAPKDYRFISPYTNKLRNIVNKQPYSPINRQYMNSGTMQGIRTAQQMSMQGILLDKVFKPLKVFGKIPAPSSINIFNKAPKALWKLPKWTTVGRLSKNMPTAGKVLGWGATGVYMLDPLLNFTYIRDDDSPGTRKKKQFIGDLISNARLLNPIAFLSSSALKGAPGQRGTIPDVVIKHLAQTNLGPVTFKAAMDASKYIDLNAVKQALNLQRIKKGTQQLAQKAKEILRGYGIDFHTSKTQQGTVPQTGTKIEPKAEPTAEPNVEPDTAAKDVSTTQTQNQTPESQFDVISQQFDAVLGQIKRAYKITDEQAKAIKDFAIKRYQPGPKFKEQFVNYVKGVIAKQNPDPKKVTGHIDGAIQLQQANLQKKPYTATLKRNLVQRFFDNIGLPERSYNQPSYNFLEHYYNNNIKNNADSLYNRKGKTKLTEIDRDLQQKYPQIYQLLQIIRNMK